MENLVKTTVVLLHSIILLLASGISHAQSSINEISDEMLDAADQILEGTVTGIESGLDKAPGGGLSTYISLGNVKTYRGSTETKDVAIKLPGGEYLGLSVNTQDIPAIDEGDRVLVLLRENYIRSPIVNALRGIFLINSTGANTSLTSFEDVGSAEREASRTPSYVCGVFATSEGVQSVDNDCQKSKNEMPSAGISMVDLLTRVEQHTFKSPGKKYINPQKPEKLLRRYPHYRGMNSDADWDVELVQEKSSTAFEAKIRRLASAFDLKASDVDALFSKSGGTEERERKAIVNELNILTAAQMSEDRVLERYKAYVSSSSQFKGSPELPSRPVGESK